MTQPASYDFAVRRGSAGDYAAIIFTILQIDGLAPVPLLGSTVTLTITLACGTTLVKSSAAGDVTLDPVAGTVTWLPTVAETLAIAPGRIDTYDLTILFPNGSLGPYLTGFIVGLDDGDMPPSGCAATGTGLSTLVRVIKVLVPGTPGTPGNLLTRYAAAIVAGHQAVRSITGGIGPATSDDLLGAGATLGISTNAAQVGQPVTVQSSGELIEQTWNWKPGAVFLGLSGALTQTPPTTGVLQQIGVSTSPTSILVDIQDPTVRH